MDEQTTQEYVTLYSKKDGTEFKLPKHIAVYGSVTIANIIQSSNDDIEDIIPLNVPSHIIEKLVEYFMYKYQYQNATGIIPEFVIEPKDAIDLLLIANFLDC